MSVKNIFRELWLQGVELSLSCLEECFDQINDGLKPKGLYNDYPKQESWDAHGNYILVPYVGYLYKWMRIRIRNLL